MLNKVTHVVVHEGTRYISVDMARIKEGAGLFLIAVLGYLEQEEGAYALL